MLATQSTGVIAQCWQSPVNSSASQHRVGLPGLSSPARDRPPRLPARPARRPGHADEVQPCPRRPLPGSWSRSGRWSA